MQGAGDSSGSQQLIVCTHDLQFDSCISGHHLLLTPTKGSLVYDLYNYQLHNVLYRFPRSINEKNGCLENSTERTHSKNGTMDEILRRCNRANCLNEEFSKACNCLTSLPVTSIDTLNLPPCQLHHVEECSAKFNIGSSDTDIFAKSEIQKYCENKKCPSPCVSAKFAFLKISSLVTDGIDSRYAITHPYLRSVVSLTIVINDFDYQVQLLKKQISIGCIYTIQSITLLPGLGYTGIRTYQRFREFQSCAETAYSMFCK